MRDNGSEDDQGKLSEGNIWKVDFPNLANPAEEI